MGILLLIGIVVTNAIVLIAFVEQLRVKGMKVYDARHQRRQSAAASDSHDCPDNELRAGAPSSCTPAGGGGIISAELATVIIGGLISSTCLTLIVVPVLYSIFNESIPQLIGKNHQQVTAIY